jgi:hypothetical protein
MGAQCAGSGARYAPGQGGLLSLHRFEHRAPSAQTAVDVFAGRWASDLSRLLSVENTGGADLFMNDPRPGMAASVFGRGTGRLDGMRVLELGPLEGGHAYQLEQLGAAHVTAVDADVEAYLKCLIVKETVGLKRCSFLLGDALAFLRASTNHYDLVFCSGLLYEVADPISLIKACCEVSNRCFVWTHYYDPESPAPQHDRTARSVTIEGMEARYHESGEDAEGRVSAWMDREALLDAFRRFGLDEITILADQRDHPNGPAMSFTASRQWSQSFTRMTTPP